MIDLATSALIESLRKRTSGQRLCIPAQELAEMEAALSKSVYDEVDRLCGKLAFDVIDDEIFARTDSGPLYWLQNHTLTEDDHWLSKGTSAKAPFPKKSYFAYIIGSLMRPVIEPSDRCQQTYYPKTRDMMVSYSVCGFISWMCQFFPNTFWILQTAKESKAEALVKYTKILYDNQAKELKDRHPLQADNRLERVFENGSRILGVPKGEDQIRVHHPWGYFADEAAFLPEFGECIAAVQPVARQIVAVSTGSPGVFGDACAQ